LSFFSQKTKLAWVLVPALASLAIDLSTKAWAKASLDDFYPTRVTDFLNLVLALNSGAAFSLLSGEGATQGLKMAGLALLAMIPLVWFYRLAGPKDKATLVALGLVLGGALGNVHDRLRYNGVVDFLDFHWGDNHWPSFNAADVFICLGLGLLILFTVLNMGQKPGMGRTKSDRKGQSRRKGTAAAKPTGIRRGLNLNR
jgi:signal peptidase II